MAIRRRSPTVIKTSKARVDVIGFGCRGSHGSRIRRTSFRVEADIFPSTAPMTSVSSSIRGRRCRYPGRSNIGADGKLDVKTGFQGAAVKMDGGNLDVKADGTTVKMVPGKAPEVGLPKGILVQEALFSKGKSVRRVFSWFFEKWENGISQGKVLIFKKIPWKSSW